MMSPRTLLWPITATMFFAGCSGLRLDNPLRFHEGDVPTYGRSASRNNTTDISIAPPLILDWEQDISAGVGDGSPAVVDSMLFLGNLRGELFALHARTGKRVGWVGLGGAIQGTPLVDGNLAIVALSGAREALVAYDLAEGKVRWRQQLGDMQVSPLLIGTRVYTATVDGQVYCIDRANGDIIWKFEIPDNTTLKGIRSTPAGNDSCLVFGGDNGAVYRLDAATGKMRWKVTADAAVYAPVVVSGQSAYVSTLHGTVMAIDLSSGAVRWTHSAGSPVYGPVLVDTARVIVGTTGGVVIAMNRDSGVPLWSCNLQSPVNSGALSTASYLYFGTLKKEIIAIATADGSIAWHGTVSGRIKTTPVAALGRVFIATDDRTILSFRGTAP